MKALYFKIIFVLIFIEVNSIEASDITLPGNPDEALIILGTEFAKKKDLINLIEYITERCNYDVIILDYYSKKGIDKCIKNLKKELIKINYQEYDKVNFLCFIPGGIILKEYLTNEKLQNLGKIVVMRAPIEERISNIASYIYPDFLIRLTHGKTVIDLSTYDFNNIYFPNISTGLIIETKQNLLAQKMAKKLKKKAKDDPVIYEKIIFNPDSMMKSFTDHMYVELDHNAMYINPDMYVENVISFMVNKHFGINADRDKTDLVKEIYPKY
ncbi:MAG: hypothetical protein JXB17_11845 [Bacteroidales bacterium]|nr:hypothetical protein [Bacteroidales bacterium]